MHSIARGTPVDDDREYSSPPRATRDAKARARARWWRWIGDADARGDVPPTARFPSRVRAKRVARALGATKPMRGISGDRSRAFARARGRRVGRTTSRMRRDPRSCPRTYRGGAARRDARSRRRERWL